MKDEVIMCFKREDLDEFIDKVENEADPLTDLVVWKNRSEVEADFNFVQIIPVAVLTKDDKIFAYTRGNTGGEGRLHGKLSISIGGHLQREEGLSLIHNFWSGFYRELEEEVGLSTHDMGRDFKHLVYTEEDDVSKVHIGAVFLCEVKTEVMPQEACIQNGRFMSIEEIEEYGNLELWTSLILKRIKDENDK